jgi:SAM-dependent methyltransferase
MKAVARSTSAGDTSGTPASPPQAARIKTRAEVRDTLNLRSKIDRGFLSNRALLVLTASVMATAFLAPAASAVLVLCLATDYAVFFVRRKSVLAMHLAGEPKFRTPADFERASRVWREAGIPEPTMSDFESAAGLTTRPWSNDLRYDLLRAMYQQGSVVDIGSGDGRLCWRYQICRPEDYTGVDPGRDLIRVLREKTGGLSHGVVAVADATTLPDSCADLVTCSECFEHLPDPGAALREFSRISKPGGTIVIQSPSAYRVRNLNPFHILATFLGRWAPAVLLRAVVIDNTFLTAFTYHWDFTYQDFERYVEGLPLRLVKRTTHTYRFNPRGSTLHRLAYRVAQWPIANRIWWDMTIVFRREPA